jgi:hypothetical protein
LQEFEQHAALVVGGDEVLSRFRLRHAHTPSPASLLHCSTSHSVAREGGVIQRVRGVRGAD